MNQLLNSDTIKPQKNRPDNIKYGIIVSSSMLLFNTMEKSKKLITAPAMLCFLFSFMFIRNTLPNLT